MRFADQYRLLQLITPETLLLIALSGSKKWAKNDL